MGSKSLIVFFTKLPLGSYDARLLCAVEFYVQDKASLFAVLGRRIGPVKGIVKLLVSCQRQGRLCKAGGIKTALGEDTR